MGIDLLTVAASFGSGIASAVVAYIMSGRRRRRRHEESLPRCSCGHTHAHHAAETAKCHKQIRYKRFERGVFRDWVWEPCTCQQYDGPTPIPSFFPSAILPLNESKDR